MEKLDDFNMVFLNMTSMLPPRKYLFINLVDFELYRIKIR